MLSTTRSRKNSATGSRAQESLTSIAFRRAAAFALARPGTVVLLFLFGGLGVVISINALWMQSDRHPAPLFHQAALAPQPSAALPKRGGGEPPAAVPVGSPGGIAAPATSSTAAQEVDSALPPSRPTALGRIDGGSTPVVKAAIARHVERDPLADIISETGPMPPASIKPSAARSQTGDKASRGPSSGNDALANLITQTAKGR